MSTDDLFVTNIEEILEILDDAKRVLLYDTVAISSHKLAYRRSRSLLLPYFQKPGDVVIMTRTIQKELEEGDETGEYRSYLQNFAPILVVKEADFIKILEEDYHPMQAKNKLKDACSEAFSTIQPLQKAIQELDRNRLEVRALDLYDSIFASNNDVNKGEYSLLWLSLVLRKRLANELNIRFIGMDSDLFVIVERCYFTPEKILDVSGRHGEVDIVSTETLLQGVYRLNGSEEELTNLTHAFRHDQHRRIWVREINVGIPSRMPIRKAMINGEFVDLVTKKQIEVVY